MAMTVDSSRQIYVRQNNNSTLAQMVGNSCVWTQLTNNPWWAVDLGAALVVFGVLLTSRAENYGIVI